MNGSVTDPPLPRARPQLDQFVLSRRIDVSTTISGIAQLKKPGTQLFACGSSLTRTITSPPGAAFSIEAGTVSTCAFVTAINASSWLTRCSTSSVVAVGRMAIRAPSRVACVAVCFTNIMRPSSTNPKVNNIINGAIAANSTTAAPLRLGFCLFRRRIISGISYKSLSV